MYPANNSNSINWVRQPLDSLTNLKGLGKVTPEASKWSDLVRVFGHQIRMLNEVDHFAGVTWVDVGEMACLARKRSHLALQLRKKQYKSTYLWVEEDKLGAAHKRW